MQGALLDVESTEINKYVYSSLKLTVSQRQVNKLTHVCGLGSCNLRGDSGSEEQRAAHFQRKQPSQDLVYHVDYYHSLPKKVFLEASRIVHLCLLL